MPERKSLWIVHTESSLGWGGQELRILSEAAGMMRRGHRVSLLCPPEARIFTEAKRRDLPVAGLAIGRKNLRGVRALHAWGKANAADVFNTHSSTDSWLVALAGLLRPSPPPVVRTRHISAAIPGNFPTRWLYCSATRHLVTTGGALRDQLIRENGYPAEHITSIPTGIDSAYFVPGDRSAARARLRLDQHATFIGIVATLRSWKGHRYLIEALGPLGPEVRLLVVGDGPQRENLAARAKELNLAGRVQFAGNQDDVLPWLQALDAFALPSYANEGVPQALVQAMLCALPCVTTDAGSIPEAARHLDTALVAPARDVEALTAALKQLLSDPGLRERLGARARKHAASNFGLESMLDRMEAVFLDAVNHG